MRYFIIVFISILFSCSNPTTSDTRNIREKSTNHSFEKNEEKSDSAHFSPVFFNDTLMIFEELVDGLDGYLISHKKQNFERIQTTKNHIYWTEIFEKKVTLTNLSTQSAFDLAYFGKLDSINWLKSTIITDSTLIDSIKNQIDLEKYKEYFSDYGGPISSVMSIVRGDLKIQHFSFHEKNFHLITYMVEPYENHLIDGFSFLMTQDTIHPISGPCSSGESSLFTLNENLYIHTNSSCCDCGIVVEQLWEHSEGNSSMKMVIEDGSWSN